MNFRQGTHGSNKHCTAHMFCEDSKYIGTVHFFLDARMATIALDGLDKLSAKQHPFMAKWRPRNLKKRLNTVTILQYVF